MKLVEPMREAYARWQALLEHDGIDPITATIVRLAVDGLWFTEMFGFDDAICTGERRAQIMTRLKEMCSSEPRSTSKRKSRRGKA